MERLDAARLVVNADDFGRSRSINEAVVLAHNSGILTSASLMVNEVAAAEAVQLAWANPGLGVGLHLALVCGAAGAKMQDAPRLVRKVGRLPDSAPAAGFRFFFSREIKAELEREIALQFSRFSETGLILDHVNGHLNIHLHPSVLEILIRRRRDFGIKAMRVTRDPLRTNLRLASGAWGYRLSHWLIFTLLSRVARKKLKAAGVCSTERVYGLLQNGRMNEEFVGRLLEQLPAGTSEVYSHPSMDHFRNELDALRSERVRVACERRGISRIRYQDL